MKERAQMRALFCIWPMQSPFSLPPHPLAQKAAAEVIDRIHAYMRAHPESELHRCGKMFGVLVYTDEGINGLEDERYIAAFSAQLDGSYHHEGFVPPIYEMPSPPVGHSKDESRRLQRLLFAQYNILNGKGESKSLLETQFKRISQLFNCVIACPSHVFTDKKRCQPHGTCNLRVVLVILGHLFYLEH